MCSHDARMIALTVRAGTATMPMPIKRLQLGRGATKVHHFEPEKIRNVVLLSHSSAGKTSLAEAMLFDSGAISRLGSVSDGQPTADYNPPEIKRQLMVNR